MADARRVEKPNAAGSLPPAGRTIDRGAFPWPGRQAAGPYVHRLGQSGSGDGWAAPATAIYSSLDRRPHILSSFKRKLGTCPCVATAHKLISLQQLKSLTTNKVSTMVTAKFVIKQYPCVATTHKLHDDYMNTSTLISFAIQCFFSILY
jgi:hypothetical protein